MKAISTNLNNSKLCHKMLPRSADTLVCDTMQISAWQNDGAYNYHQELMGQQKSLMEWLMEKMMEVLQQILGSTLADQLSKPLLMMAGISLALVILWFVYKNRPELFSFIRKVKREEKMEDDSIYGVDFRERIHEAVSRTDWREAVRWAYLQTLKTLNDGGKIDWQPYKTPTQYVYEFRSKAFRDMTNNFLRVRYGNFDADKPLYETMFRLQAEIGKETEP